MQLFYNPEIKSTDTLFVFDKEESKHIVKVLRKKESDILFVTNGLGFLFETKISLASDSKCTVQICNFEKYEPSTFQLHIAIAPTKMNERLEWFLEKATEIGIHEITPLICEHSERKVLKTERLKKVIESAMKQSNQYYLPVLNEPISFTNFVKSKRSGKLLIAHCEEVNKENLNTVSEKNTLITILIGPEGDFSKKEIDLALSNNYKPISLGNTRLRTETAGVVACCMINSINQ